MMNLAEEEDLDEITEIIFRQQCRFIDARVKADADIIGGGNVDILDFDWMVDCQKIKVEYVFQDITNLSEGYAVPEGRV